jgi:uncharacterized protein
MEYWPWWAGGLGLTLVVVGHWVLARRMLAVSGRFTAIVDRLRHGPVDEPQMTRAEMIAAMQAMTADEFGDTAVPTPPEAPPEAPLVGGPAVPRPPMIAHLSFLGGLLVGGLVAALLTGSFETVSGLHSPMFRDVFGAGLGGTLALLFGGVFIGFGTRMSGGCTSGHGLCGVSRFQPGSLAATASFFGTGIGVSFLLGALS